MIPWFLIGAISNAIRGGQWRGWLGVTGKYEWFPSDTINALIYGIVVYYVTSNPLIAAVSMPLMWLGALPGWGDYIGALGGWRIDNLKEIKLIDILISPLKKRPKWWGFAGLTIRGLYWGFILSLPFFWFDISTAISFILCGSSMGIAYWAALNWMKYRIGKVSDEWTQAGWGLGEIFYGAILWSALS